MRIRTKALLCMLLLSTAACGMDDVALAGPSAPGRLAPPAGPSLTENCTLLSKAATQYSGSTNIQTSIDSIAYNCRTEMCAFGTTAVDMTFIEDGNNTNNNDQIRYRCRSNSTPYTYGAYQTFDSQDSCWNCVSGCATNCPSGYTCYPITGTNGPDCTAYKCDVSDGKNWQLVDNGYGVAPTCEVLYCPPPLAIDVDGPSSIRPGAECSWSATASGGTGGPYTITWYVAGTSVGSGTYLTADKPSGVSGSNWSWKAEVYDGSTSTYVLYPITESSSAPICAS